ncbi:MAG: NAD(P)(+) transhydrogenase (Re/Si-specific) subunit beta [Verrucomicrobiota bacterium JB022]|nr:NAD(P)(+) transhydrogenase (Re/Si-specific) subunit beta [Verrucomicrobiota bacterium JB022]
MEVIINLSYIAASILFIFGIKMLGKADTAKRGNLVSAWGMGLAIVVTCIHPAFADKILWIVLAFAIGGAIGAVAAKKVPMTGMPEMVALFNGVGGLSSVLVGWAEYVRLAKPYWDQARFNEQTDTALLPPLDLLPPLSGFTMAVIFLAVFIGAVTFTGSIYAWGKLSGKLGGAAKTFPAQKACNALLLAVTVLCGVLFPLMPEGEVGLLLLTGATLGALLLGIFGVMPIGGGDMPVVISLLNSLSGLAAAAAGFVIVNNVLIVAGCLVGCSGLILTVIMCKAMNRTLTNVLFSGFGSTQSSQQVEGEMKALSVEDAYYVLESARNVVFVPGYGMAVAQAQHVVKELAELLEENGAEVRFAIHPVAGRMPGHMNVLLAEADVPYEQLCEMDAVNPTMEMVDVAIVIGANDVVNPAAGEDPSSPIYGMPIINVHHARTVFALKRGKGAGFSGLVNTLFFRENTRMIYGDAKATIAGLVGQFKEK